MRPEPTRRPLRILFVPSAYYPHVGGIEETTRQLALAFRARGHDVSVLTNCWPAGVRASEVLEGIAVRRLAFPLPAARPVSAARFLGVAPGAVLALVRHVRRSRPDVIHVIGAGPPAVYLAMLRPLLGARLVFTAQGELTFDAERVFERSATLRGGLRWMLRRADAVTACSSYVLSGLRAFGDVRRGGEVIPNGVEPKDFDVALDGEDDFGPYVLAVGRLVPQKGFDVLLDAFAEKSLEDLSLVVAGDGMERGALEERGKKLGIDARVHFLGAVDRAQIGQLLRRALAFALPSRGEPFGIALLEAMAAGVPSVAAAAGGIPEFARNEENALLIPVDDSRGLALALVRLSEEPELRKRLMSGGRQTAAEFAWSRISERYERVYLDVIGHPQ